MNSDLRYNVYLRKARNNYLREQAVEIIQKYCGIDQETAQTQLHNEVFPLLKDVNNEQAQRLILECADRGLFAIVRLIR